MGDLRGVDGLPAGERDEVDSALAQQVLDRIGLRCLGLSEDPRLDVFEQGVDGLLSAFLVGADDAAGAALDPAGGVVAGAMAAALGFQDPAAGVQDRAAPLVESDSLDPDPGVADRAQQQPALELLAVAGVVGPQ